MLATPQPALRLPAPLTQGSLLVDAMPEFGMKGVAGDGDAEPSAASGGCSEAEHPQRSKKSSKRAARRYFRAPQGGGGRCCRRLPLKRICAQYGFGFFAPKKLNPYPAQLSVKGDCQGGSPVPLDRILVPFVRTKGTPRRRAVQALHPAKSMPRRRRLQTGPRRIGV